MHPFVAIAALLTVGPGLWGPLRNGTTTGELTVARGEAEVLWRRPVAGPSFDEGRFYIRNLREIVAVALC